VQALAGSIALQGLFTPVVVRAAREGLELVAGFPALTTARTRSQQIPANRHYLVVELPSDEAAKRSIEDGSEGSSTMMRCGPRARPAADVEPFSLSICGFAP
jgi:hypothetical protein